MKRTFLVIALLMVSSFPAASQILKIDPLTNQPYPPIDWAHMVRGKDYVPYEVLVILKENISPADEVRVKKEMSSIGRVTFHSFKVLRMKYYRINITNGMNEKQATEMMNSDSAVQVACVSTIEHVYNPNYGSRVGKLSASLTPTPEIQK